MAITRQELYPVKAIEIATEKIDPSLIRKKQSGKDKKGNVTYLDYVSGETVITWLNNAYNYVWSWIIEDQWVQQSVDRLNKKTNEYEHQAPVAHVSGRLEIPLFDENGKVIYTIIKSAHGAQPIIGGQSEQENVFKSANTDALKKAARQLGFGSELARSEEEQLYNDYLTEQLAIEYSEQYETEEIPVLDESVVKLGDEIRAVLSTSNNFTPEDITRLEPCYAYFNHVQELYELNTEDINEQLKLTFPEGNYDTLLNCTVDVIEMLVVAMKEAEEGAQ